MALSTRPIVNFAGGEASPKLYGRSDTVPYFATARILENIIVTQYGSAFKTSGTKFAERTKDMSKAGRLIPFIFSSGQSYILEFGNAYIRVFQGGGSVIETAVNISGITKADPAVVTTATAHGYSDGDVIDIESVVGMTEVNEKRFIVANKTSNTFELQDEDAVDIDSSAYTAYDSAGTCERVYQVVSPYDETDIPDLKYTQQADVMYITHPDYAPRKLSRTSSSTWTLATITYDEFDYPPFLSINTTATTMTPSATTGAGITITSSTDFFDADHVGAYIMITHGATTGYALITAFGSATSVTATVIVDFGNTTASTDWYEGAWSDYQGFPTDVKFYEQRLYYCATTRSPLDIWGSVIGEFDNYDYGVADDTDAINYTLGSAQVDKLRWIYPTSILNCGTAGGIFTLSSGTNADPISPSNISVKQQTENGSSTVSPIRIGSFVYYVERSGKVLGQFAYSLDFDAYVTEDITYLNDHILGDGVVEMALQTYPDSVAWCVLDDGTIATMTREYENKIKGWTRQVMAGTDAEVESIAIIPNGVEDQVWIIVKRTVNGGTVRYVEYFQPVDFGDDQDDAWFVHSGLEYDGTQVSSVSGLEHLEGESVQILADGAVHPNKTVTSGAVTLEWSANHIIVGLGYTATIQTMDIGIGTDQQTAQAKVTHIGKASIRFLNSLGCKFGDGTTTDVIPFRDSSMNMDEPPPLFTGDKEVQFPSGHVKNKFIYLYQEQPLPMHVLGIYPRILIAS